MCGVREVLGREIGGGGGHHGASQMISLPVPCAGLDLTRRGTLDMVFGGEDGGRISGRPAGRSGSSSDLAWDGEAVVLVAFAGSLCNS